MSHTRMTTLDFMPSELSSLDDISCDFVSALCIESCKEYCHETIRSVE